MITTSQKHHYLQNGLSRFALVTIGRFKEREMRGDIALEPAFFLNNNEVRIRGDEEVVIEAACQGMRDAEAEFHWSGEPHLLISLEGLLVDGIDAHAARIAARTATESLILNQAEQDGGGNSAALRASPPSFCKEIPNRCIKKSRTFQIVTTSNSLC